MPAQRSDDLCWVYFIQVKGGGPIKVGVSQDLSSRLEVLQTACPFELELLCVIRATYFAETVLHDMQKPFWVRGEWYEPNAALAEIIAHVTEHNQFPDHIAREMEIRWGALERHNAEETRRRKARAASGIKHFRLFYEPSDRHREKLSESAVRRHKKRREGQGRGRAVDFQIIAKPMSAD